MAFLLRDTLGQTCVVCRCSGVGASHKREGVMRVPSFHQQGSLCLERAMSVLAPGAPHLEVFWTPRPVVPRRTCQGRAEMLYRVSGILFLFTGTSMLKAKKIR